MTTQMTATASEQIAFEMLNKAYLKQQNLEYTAENIEDCGLAIECMDLIYENENVYIVNYREMGQVEYCNIIRKDDEEIIETVELA